MAELDNLTLGIEVKKCKECEYKEHSIITAKDDRFFASAIESNCHTGDLEVDHEKADAILTSILVKLGYEETVKAWIAVDKWYA